MFSCQVSKIWYPLHISPIPSTLPGHYMLHPIIQTQHFMEHTNYEACHKHCYPTLILLPPCQVQIFSSAFLALGCESKFPIYLKLLDKCIQLRNSEIKTFTTPLILDTEGKRKLIVGRGIYCSSSEWGKGKGVGMPLSPYLN